MAEAGNTAEEVVDGHMMTGGTALLAQDAAGSTVEELERHFVDIAAVDDHSHWKLLLEAVGSLTVVVCSHWSWKDSIVFSDYDSDCCNLHWHYKWLVEELGTMATHWQAY